MTHDLFDWVFLTLIESTITLLTHSPIITGKLSFKRYHIIKAEKHRINPNNIWWWEKTVLKKNDCWSFIVFLQITTHEAFCKASSHIMRDKEERHQLEMLFYRQIRYKKKQLAVETLHTLLIYSRYKGT